MTELGAVIARLRPGRTIHGVAAVFLPFRQPGGMDLDAFCAHVARTCAAGLVPAVNMDTGFGPQLSRQQRLDVLAATRAAAGERAPFVAGAIVSDDGDPVASYRRELDTIVEAGGTPIVFQSPWLTSGDPATIAGRYATILDGHSGALAFELGEAFAPFGRIYDDETFERLLQIEALAGLKHSSLSRTVELRRLEAAQRSRPDFRIYTGNDLAIDMVCFGSDYLLGLATFAPDAFAVRDLLWAGGDASFYEVNDALQAIGAVAFRDPVPAYKSTAAVWLDMTGQVPGARPHPSTPARPEWERDLLEPLWRRLRSALGR